FNRFCMTNTSIRSSVTASCDGAGSSPGPRRTPQEAAGCAWHRSDPTRGRSLAERHPLAALDHLDLDLDRDLRLPVLVEGRGAEHAVVGDAADRPGQRRLVLDARLPDRGKKDARRVIGVLGVGAL